VLFRLESFELASAKNWLCTAHRRLFSGCFPPRAQPDELAMRSSSANSGYHLCGLQAHTRRRTASQCLIWAIACIQGPVKNDATKHNILEPSRRLAAQSRIGAQHVVHRLDTCITVGGQHLRSWNKHGLRARTCRARDYYWRWSNGICTGELASNHTLLLQAMRTCECGRHAHQVSSTE
jgi:hypothetical protein